jgi:hypothetical protein
MRRTWSFVVFAAAVALTLGMKAIHLGWLEPRVRLELGGKPALLFFNKARGCRCEMVVYLAAEGQMQAWDPAIPVVRIDLEQRPDLAQQYEVVRAPTLILVDGAGRVVWRQDEAASDTAPLGVSAAETNIRGMLGVGP